VQSIAVFGERSSCRLVDSTRFHSHVDLARPVVRCIPAQRTVPETNLPTNRAVESGPVSHITLRVMVFSAAMCAEDIVSAVHAGSNGRAMCIGCNVAPDHLV